MINTLSLLVGLVGVALVVIRAMIADKTIPWFAPVDRTVAVKPKSRVRRPT